MQSHPATRHSWAVTSYPFSPWCRLRFDQRYFAPRCHIGFLWQKWVRRSPRPALSHLGDWSSRSKAWWSWVEIETTLWDYIVIEVDYSWVDVAVDRFYKYIYIYIYIDIYIYIYKTYYRERERDKHRDTMTTTSLRAKIPRLSLLRVLFQPCSLNLFSWGNHFKAIPIACHSISHDPGASNCPHLWQNSWAASRSLEQQSFRLWFRIRRVQPGSAMLHRLTMMIQDTPESPKLP